jgi:hypothetical protein
MLLNCTHLFVQQKQKADTASKEIWQNAFPHWKMGDANLFVINHSTEKGKPVISNLTYYANVILLDSSAEGYRLVWYYVHPPS